MTGYNVYSALSGHCLLALGGLGKFEDGKAVLEKGLKNALAVKDRLMAGCVIISNSWLSYLEGDGNVTADHAQEAIRHFEETGADLFLGLTWSWIGAGYYLLGDYERARTHAEKGLNLQKESGVPFLLPICYSSLALIHSAPGDLQSAQGCAE